MKDCPVNLVDYPLDHPDSRAYGDLVGHFAELLRVEGFIAMDGFLTPEAVETFRQEIDKRMPDAYFSAHGPGAYYDDFPHPLPMALLNSKSYCMGRERLLSTAMDQLYGWEPLKRFIADLTGVSQIFPHEDPSNALIVQLYEAGCEIGWHFDRTLFTSILNLGAPEEGGLFQCVPDLRSDDDPGYAGVWEVLQGRSSRVKSYAVQEGALTLMLGRHSFHRVTRVEGKSPRISLVLTYELEPGIHLDRAARKRIFGPNAPNQP